MRELGTLHSSTAKFHAPPALHVLQRPGEAEAGPVQKGETREGSGEGPDREKDPPLSPTAQTQGNGPFALLPELVSLYTQRNLRRECQMTRISLSLPYHLATEAIFMMLGRSLFVKQRKKWRGLGYYCIKCFGGDPHGHHTNSARV